MAELVGILNLTPDSFSESGEFFYRPQAAMAHADRLFEEGAAIVDVGAESTRPRAIPLDQETEWRRLEPVLGKLIAKYPGRISLDTRHPEIARRAFELDAGEVIINDITGMNDPRMVDTVAKYGGRCIVGHMHGLDVQAVHDPKAGKIDDVHAVTYDLMAKHALLVDRGVDPAGIIVDPNIGFGKTPELNVRLLEVAYDLRGYNVMVGASRKRFLDDYFVAEGEDRTTSLEPSVRAARIAIDAGAAYVRVHDVAGHRQLLY